MGLSLNPKYLKRYKNILVLLMKYGRADLVKRPSLVDIDDLTVDISEAEAFAVDLEKLGPVYVKLGQLFSTRPDILPLAYVQALSRLQDKVEPVEYELIERTIASELGVRISKAFREFEREPLASASVGQVHRAKLRDGRQVAVKVQRPGIREQAAEDLDALMEIAEVVDHHTKIGERYNFEKMIEEFRKSFFREFDYKQEAKHLRIIHRNLRGFDKILVPLPIEDYTTSRILTMEYVSGKKITSLGPLARIELDGAELADQLLRAYLKQVLVDGIFHADPHPGNLFLTDDARIALLDLGMVDHVGSELQNKLLSLIVAVSESNADDASRILTRIGTRTSDFDQESFRREIGIIVAKTAEATLDQMETGTLLLELVQISGQRGLRIPTELTMLAKTLLNLDQIGKILNPKFNPATAIQDNALALAQQQTLKGFTLGGIFAEMTAIKEVVQRIPERIRDLLERLENNDLELRIKTIDEQKLIGGLQKIANRITLGLILAASILAASNFISVPTDFTLFGYPGLAIILLIAAVGGGIALIISILLSDE